jgi:AraC family transcriptional regulator of adaptative response/methylated-DNA-[protein]-cysteine methyltransferase
MIPVQQGVVPLGKSEQDEKLDWKAMSGGGAVQDEARWKAILKRDPASNGAFVYAVRSTGIYCRPTCPSRRPKRAGVSFFESPPDAEAAGYRACRRCHPADASRPDPHGAKILEACRYIDGCEDRVPTLSEIGARVGMSPHHLQRSFKRALGVTPRRYADARRVDRLKKRLQEGQGVTPALYDAGYGSSSRLYEKAPRQLGMTPATYRKGGAGETIRYTVPRTSLGRILLAGTERGICRVSMGETISELTDGLRKEFPNADLVRDDEGLQSWVGALLEYLNGERPLVKIPTDIQATAFQRRVWEVLQTIPRGETRSYSEVARRIGRPSATRAVARACATNPVALVIPCHRVVRKDGSPGGYGWGEKRKRTLLALERGREGASRD